MAEPLVLVVDDDTAILDLMVRRLERRGLHPDSAPDGPTAAGLVQEKAYDLVLTDIYMPGGMSGIDLLRKAKERDPHVQVIVVTAAAALDNAVEALNEGAFSYLIKPFDHLSVIDNSVSRALDYRRLILDNLRMAEIQRRRGDLLEAEVTDRIQLMRRRQQDTSEMLARLPFGIVVADAEGRLLLTNSAAEELLKRRTKAGREPLQEYLSRLIPPTYTTTADVALDDVTLRVIAQPLPPLQGKIRTLVVVQEREPASPSGAGVPSLVSRLKPAVDWLAERPLPPEEGNVVRGLQMQILAMERLQDAEEGPPALPPPAPKPAAHPATPIETRALDIEDEAKPLVQPAASTPVKAKAQAPERVSETVPPNGPERSGEPAAKPPAPAAPPRAGLLKKGLARRFGPKPDGGPSKP